MRPKLFSILVLSVLSFSLCHSVSAQSTITEANKNAGKSQILTPEVFELANIAFALTEFSQTNENMTEKSGGYYARMAKHFAPYKNHSLIQKLDALVKKNYMAYVANRGYSIDFVFDGKKLKETNAYPPERKFQLLIFGNAFQDLSLWEDFAEKSDFRQFFADNQTFYRKTLESVERSLPIAKIWTWLESEFPARFDRYTIYVSPLIGGTHSTFNSNSKSENQCFMFVSDASRYDAKRFTSKQIEGLYTGIVFTEIDHNYNNPISQKYAKEIAQAMPDLKKWSSGAEAQNGNYQSALKIFDEYATHSLYLLYIYNNFTSKDYEIIRQNRVDLMVKRRGFINFAAFNDEFIRLHKTKKQNAKTADIYPQIIQWMLSQNK